MRFHHAGLLVESIDEAAETFAGLFSAGAVGKKIHVASQGVNVCFVDQGGGSFIELVEPCGEESVVRRMAKKGISFYHAGYKTGGIEAEAARLEGLGFKAFDYFRSEAFAGKRCLFLQAPQGFLIELIES